MLFKKRSDFETQWDWLHYLQNNLGFNDLQIQGSKTNKEGEITWYKRYNFLSLVEDESKHWLINEATHRNILDIEIVFDIDEEPILETAQKIMKKYSKHNPICYFTGSKSYHIHIFLHKLRGNKQLQQDRKIILKNNNADQQKTGNNMIAIEGAKHYKSGKPKIEVKI